LGPVQAGPITLTFDDVAVDGIVGNDFLPEDFYAASGVTFTSGTIPNGPFVVGNTITLSGPLNQFGRNRLPAVGQPQALKALAAFS
jgi:hypothetical protein